MSYPTVELPPALAAATVAGAVRSSARTAVAATIGRARDRTELPDGLMATFLGGSSGEDRPAEDERQSLRVKPGARFLARRRGIPQTPDG
jgi:hypothetical protein